MNSRVVSVQETQYCTECGEKISEGRRAVQTGPYFEHMNCEKVILDSMYVPALELFV